MAATHDTCNRQDFDGPEFKALDPFYGLGPAPSGVSLPSPPSSSSTLPHHPHPHCHTPLSQHIRTQHQHTGHDKGLSSPFAQPLHSTCSPSGVQRVLHRPAHATEPGRRTGPPGPPHAPQQPRGGGMAESVVGHLRSRSCPLERFAEVPHVCPHHTTSPVRHPHGVQSQDGQTRQRSASTETGAHSHTVSGIFSGTGASTHSPQIVPGVHLTPACSTLVPFARPTSKGLVVFCKNCRLPTLGHTTSDTPGAISGGTRQSTDHREILAKSGHLVTVEQCENGGSHSPSLSHHQTSEGETEDFCILPAVFSTWYASLPAHLPPPLVDTWASSTQHCLQTYGVDYFQTEYPDISLWLNPRFSDMTAVLQHMTQHHQFGFILYPHWESTDWWDSLQSMVSHVTAVFAQGVHLFRGVHQTYSRPCPWIAYIGFVDCRSTTISQAPSLHRYFQLIGTLGYPPVPPGYAANRLPKCYRTQGPPVRNSRALVLAPITSTTIAYDALLALAHSIHYPRTSILEHIVRTFTDQNTFFQLFTVGPLMPGPGFPSRLTKDTLSKAVAWGLLTHISPYLYHSAFLVPKSTPGEGRLCTNCKDTINHLIRRIPWPCDLARRNHLLQTVLSWNYASLYDFTSFFFQFELGTAVQPWFGIRQKSFKAVMTRPPQGFSPMPAAAQCTTDALLWGLPGLGHIDNIILGGMTLEALEHTKVTFLERCDGCRMALKERTSPCQQVFHHLGLQFDLQQKRYRLIPEWAERTSRLLLDISDIASTPLQLPLRVLWTALGCIFWSCYILDIILARYWATMQFTRRNAVRTSQDIHLWDSPTSLPPSVIVEWRQLHTIIGLNEWRSPPALPTDILQCRSLVACDSCELSAGMCAESFNDNILPTHHHIAWWPWPEHTQKLSMPCLEGLACIRTGEEILSQLAEPILWLDDCAPFLKALRKGFSSAPELNSIVRALRALPQKIRWQWVPTHLMPADALSRRAGYGPLQRTSGSFLSQALLAWLASSEAQQLQYGPTTQQDKQAVQQWWARGTYC